MACGRPPKPLGPPRERDDRKRAASQIESAIKAVVCLVLAVVALRVVTGSGNGGQGGEQATAKLLQMPGGQVLVALAGVVIVAAAVLLTSTAAAAVDGQGRPGPSCCRWASFNQVRGSLS